jgi:hypothetical protein
VHHELTVGVEGAAPGRRPLTRATTAGGSRADGLFLPGAAPGALRLVPVPAGVVVEAGAAGIRVAGRIVAPGCRRLLRPGERVGGQGVALELAAAARTETGTRVAAAALLRDAAAGDGPLAGPRLVVLTGSAAGERYPLAAEQTLGRGRRATLRLADSQVSRRHARLRVEREAVTIEDLGSKNGLRVNGVRVERAPVPLRPGDEIALGETELALEDPVGSAPSPASAGARPPAPGRPLLARRPPLHAAAAVLLALSALALALAAR